MNSEILRAFFRSGMFLVLVSVFLVLSVGRESAEFVVSVCTLAIGVTLMGLVLAVNHLTK